jgi:hypothetical protein
LAAPGTTKDVEKAPVESVRTVATCVLPNMSLLPLTLAGKPRPVACTVDPAMPDVGARLSEGPVVPATRRGTSSESSRRETTSRAIQRDG